ncbi:MAG: hypothetical protein RML93_06810, partial [Anaerolineales bacterium]|nr:hypothetical protein [Anaerolineales bacterium]MDW8446986.1 hypothetical protein [Anaerolineales bacterium]
ELAEAQKRAEERLTRLETTVAELAEAQKRAEERLARLETTVAELAEAQKQVISQLARLENRIGVSVEREAADAFAYTLRQKGYQLLEGPLNVPLDGEIDVLYRIADATGNQLTAVLESKLRLSYSAVENWAQRMRSVEFRQRLSQAGYPGPYLVYVYGVSIQPSAYDALKRFGIGLITDRGEWIDPPETLP